MSNVTMREMLEAGVHFGHQARYWDPRMAPYLFGQRNKIHIINLEKSLPMYRDALNFMGQLAAKKGTIMFVGTKRSAQNVIQEEALRCSMPFVNRHWLGGLLTNYRTVKQSIKKMKSLAEMEEDGTLEKMSKKDQLRRERKLNKLSRSLSGIKDMARLPDALFIIDVGYEKIAVSEAKRLGITVIGVVDSNNNPSDIDYVIPGNDDAMRSIRLYAKGVADTIIDARVSASSIGNNADDFVEINASAEPIANVKVRAKKKIIEGESTKDKTHKVVLTTKSLLKKDASKDEAVTKPTEKDEAVTKPIEADTDTNKTKQSNEAQDVGIIRIVKQPEPPYSKDSKRALWWERVQQFDNQPVSALQESIDASPPSQPPERLSGWLRFFSGKKPRSAGKPGKCLIEIKETED